MEHARIVTIDPGGFGKLDGDLGFSVAKNQAGLALALRLGLLGHCVLQRLWDADVANLYRLDGDAPGVGFSIKDQLQLLTHGLALGDHLRQLVAADGFTQSGLGAHVHGVSEVLNFKDGFFGVPDEPEDNGIHIDGDGVARQGGFSGNRSDADTLIHETAKRIHHGHDEEETGATKTTVAPEAENRDPLPLLHHFYGEQEIYADGHSDNERKR